MIRDRDRARIAAIIAKYEKSLPGRIDNLTDEQRAAYDRYKARYRRWIETLKAQCPDDCEEPEAWLFEHYLRNCDYEPTLRRDVAIALFSDTQRILNTDTDDDAARKWLEVIQS